MPEVLSVTKWQLNHGLFVLNYIFTRPNNCYLQKLIATYVLLKA